MRPSVSPTLLVVLMVVAGVAILVASSFAPPDYRDEVIGAAMFLIGWATKRPGELSATTHPDDLP